LSFASLHRDADYIIFDTGAGISRNTTAFLTAADEVIVVTMPEPTAVERFDLARGVKFETYCVGRIRGAMLDDLRHMD